jgi:hypothetical protein
MICISAPCGFAKISGTAEHGPGLLVTVAGLFLGLFELGFRFFGLVVPHGNAPGIRHRDITPRKRPGQGVAA